jgi:uncharacterized membrane protein HdeD (DUF308 family)
VLCAGVLLLTVGVFWHVPMLVEVAMILLIVGLFALVGGILNATPPLGGRRWWY